jgi:hypothetical protein
MIYDKMGYFMRVEEKQRSECILTNGKFLVYSDAEGEVIPFPYIYDRDSNRIYLYGNEFSIEHLGKKEFCSFMVVDRVSCHSLDFAKFRTAVIYCKDCETPASFDSISCPADSGKCSELKNLNKLKSVESHLVLKGFDIVEIEY